MLAANISIDATHHKTCVYFYYLRNFELVHWYS